MNRRHLCLPVLATLFVLAGCGGALTNSGGAPSGNSERLRDYAASLKANQLYAKAAEAYDRYVEESAATDQEKANIDFNTGKMLLDQLGDGEGALAHFLRVTELYEEADRDLVKEARKLSAQCLEKMGRSGAAERQLVASSKLGASDASAEIAVEESEILAKIGERSSVTRTEFEEAWNGIPAYMREQQFAGEEGKQKLLQELVSTRVFAEAARRKGLDRDPEFQRRVRMTEEGLLAQKVMEAEVTAKVELSDSDLDLYYRANKDRYVEPPSVEVAHLQAADATGIEVARAAIDAGSSFEEAVAAFSSDENTKEKGGVLGSIRQAPRRSGATGEHDPFDTYVPGLGKERDLAVAAFAMTEIGDVTGPLQTKAGFSLLRLVSKTEAREKTFEEVRAQVEGELRAEREREQQAKLVGELMKTHKVRMYPERLK